MFSSWSSSLQAELKLLSSGHFTQGRQAFLPSGLLLLSCRFGMGRRERKKKRHVEIIRKISRNFKVSTKCLIKSTIGHLIFHQNFGQSHRQLSWTASDTWSTNQLLEECHIMASADSISCKRYGFYGQLNSFWRNHYQTSFGLSLFSWCLVFTKYVVIMTTTGLWPIHVENTRAPPTQAERRHVCLLPTTLAQALSLSRIVHCEKTWENTNDTMSK